jgi:hypothetical protein
MVIHKLIKKANSNVWYVSSKLIRNLFHVDISVQKDFSIYLKILSIFHMLQGDS